GTYQFDTIGSDYDTVLHVLGDYCGGATLACNDDTVDVQSEVVVDLVAGGIYTVVVDGWGSSAGNYELNVALLGGGPNICHNPEVLPSEVPVLMDWAPDYTTGDVFQQCSFGSNERSFLWYAPADGAYQVTQTNGQNFASVAVLLGGCAVDPVLCQ